MKLKDKDMIEISNLHKNIFTIKNTNYSNEIVDVKVSNISISNYYSYLLKLKENNLHSISFNLNINSNNINKSEIVKQTKSCKNAYNNFLDNFYDYEIKVLLCTENKEAFKIANKVIEDEYRVEDILKYNEKN